MGFLGSQLSRESQDILADFHQTSGPSFPGIFYHFLSSRNPSGFPQLFLYGKLGWESLNLRRWSRSLVLFFKFVNNLTPEYTMQPIPLLRQSNNCLCGPTIIGQIHTRTLSLGTSFYQNCISEWNKLDSDIRQLPPAALFKKKLFSLIRPLPNPACSIYDPKSLAILTQLRVSLSKLYLHKFTHNFKDTVNAQLKLELKTHVLLLCHSYDIER